MAHDQDGLQIAIVGGVFSLITGIIAGIFALACEQSGSREPQATIAGSSTSTTLLPGQIAPTVAPKTPLNHPPKSADSPGRSIPASLVGHWGGIMVQYGRMKDLHYQVTLTLESRPTASGIIGRSRETLLTAQGAFVCSYLLYPHRITSTLVILSEKSRGGDPNCVDQSYLYMELPVAETVSVTVRDFVHDEVMAESVPVLLRAG